MTFPKPQYCGQSWQEMLPTEGGRICGKCEKTIVDFTEMKWREIEALQRSRGNTLCGRYSHKQLKYWGQEPPGFQMPGLKALRLPSLLLVLNLSPVFMKSQAEPQEQVVVDVVEEYNKGQQNGAFRIQGRVTKPDVRGIVSPVPYAYIYIRGYNIGVTSDEDGYYFIDYVDELNSLRQQTMEVWSFGGYDKKIIDLNRATLGINEIDIVLDPPIISFYIEVDSKPTFFQWLTKPFRGLFRKKKK